MRKYQPIDEAFGHVGSVCFFSAIAINCFAILPYALARCFECQEVSVLEWGDVLVDQSHPFARALLIWPSGFRLLLLTFVAALLCLGATGTSFWITQKATGPHVRVWGFVVRGALASFSVGILYIQVSWVDGYFGNLLGLDPLVWAAAIAAFIGFIEWPRPIGLLLVVPLMIGGLIWVSIIGQSTGISLYGL